MPRLTHALQKCGGKLYEEPIRFIGWNKAALLGHHDRDLSVNVLTSDSLLKSVSKQHSWLLPMIAIFYSVNEHFFFKKKGLSTSSLCLSATECFYGVRV